MHVRSGDADVWPGSTRLSVAGLSVQLPNDWERVDHEGVDLLVLAPGEVYRANLSIARIDLEQPGPLGLIVEAAAKAQAESLADFLEYERQPETVGGLPAIHREYAWVEEVTGAVLYQLQRLARDPRPGPPRLLELHATSTGLAYFRYAALFRRMFDSLQVERVAG